MRVFRGAALAVLLQAVPGGSAAGTPDPFPSIAAAYLVRLKVANQEDLETIGGGAHSD